ncbi:MAG TPA: hypothetical protein VM101_00025 [Flavitalea sp.]|nr:hypothetical protein [Flavitalea sp.]
MMKYLLFLCVLGIVSCETTDREPVSQQVTGYAPVYATQQVASSITSQPVKASVHPGKIYAYNNYIFQVEQNEGIHVIDNSNPQTAHKIAFISIAGCTELAMKAGILYVNNLSDLVAIDLTNISTPQVVNRIANAFPQFNKQYPQVTGAYFECVDPSKGVVVAWEEKTLTNPKCRR